MKTYKRNSHENEFLWLISLSDLMILLFVFFVVLFSFSAKKMSVRDFAQAAAIFRGEKPKKNEISELHQKLLVKLKELSLADEVEVSEGDHELVMNIREKFLFDSGHFQLKPDSAALMRTVSTILAQIPDSYRLGVEGHTDDAPIKNPLLEDNWELSSKRAHEVLKELHLPDTVLKHTIVMGYGSQSPLLPNSDGSGNSIPENRAKNRRVTLRVF